MLFLLTVATLAGILTTSVIRRTTNATTLREVRNRIYAHLLEFRLFFDEPLLIWQAQLKLLHDNARLVRLLVPSALILALPLTWLFLQLDAAYGLRPLHPGEPAVVTAELTRPVRTTDRFNLHGAGSITVETPPIRYRNQVYWRIRPASDAYGALDLSINGRVIKKSIATGDPPQLVSRRRSRSVVEFLLHPEEPRLPDCDVAWMEVDYPSAGAAWMVWFLVTSTSAALLSARIS